MTRRASDGVPGAPGSVPGLEGAPERGSTSKLPNVLRELVARGATGVVGVRTPDDSGEVRIQAGHVDDVVFGRVDGRKALARMFAAREVGFAFRESEADWPRRIELGADELLIEAAAAAAVASAAQGAFADRRHAFVVAADMTEDARVDLSGPARALLTRVRTPLPYEDVLDLGRDDDAEVLQALRELDDVGALRWLRPDAERQPLVSSLWDVSGVGERVGGRARLVFAGTPQDLDILSHSLSYIDEVERPHQPLPLVPMPHVVATLDLEAVVVDIVACPLVPVYSPLWPLSLVGAALIVRLDEAAPGLLEAAAEMAQARVVAGEALVGPLDVASVGAVAALVRAALDEIVSV